MYSSHSLDGHNCSFQSLIAALNEERVSGILCCKESIPTILEPETAVIQYHDKQILLVWYKKRLHSWYHSLKMSFVGIYPSQYQDLSL